MRSPPSPAGDREHPGLGSSRCGKPHVMHEPAENDPDRHAAEPSRGRSTPFQRIARSATAASGSGWAALAVVAAGACWTLVGWSAGFPRWWELVATAGVPFVTLLMVVLLQHTQNHHA